MRLIWSPALLMGAVGGLVGYVWHYWGLLLIAPLSLAVGWAVSQEGERR